MSHSLQEGLSQYDMVMTSTAIQKNIVRAGLQYIVPGFRPKTSSFWLLYQHHSSTDCTRVLFKPLKDLASLLVCTRKKFFGWGLQIFCEWRHKWSSFWAILAHVTWPKAQPLGQSISLMFSLETRLESFFWAFDQLSNISGSKVMI